MRKIKVELLLVSTAWSALYAPKQIGDGKVATYCEFSLVNDFEIQRRERIVLCELKTKDYLEQFRSRSPEEVLRQRKQAESELRELRQIGADSFVVWFFKEHQRDLLSDNFHKFARPENYQDVITVILEGCYVDDEQEVKQPLLNYISQFDSGCSFKVFDWRRYLDGVSETIIWKVKESKPLCDRIDSLWVAAGRSPKMWLVFKGMGQKYQRYLKERQAQYDEDSLMGKWDRCSIL